MAAAAIAAGLSLAPDIIKLITGLVHKDAPVVEQQYGPGTGPVKFTDLFGKVVGALTSAANLGQIPKTLPSDEVIKFIIECVVTSMNLTGQLTGVPTAPTPASIAPVVQAVTLKAGQTLTVTVQ